MHEAGRLSRVPKVPAPSTDKVGRNFLTMGDVDAICEKISDDLAPVVRFAALRGWQKGEVLGLRWSRVDFEAGVVRLDPGSTKN